MAKSIMIQGTTSNAGKSLITAGLCRIFHQDGYKVAPFKSQNMALNSYITSSGLEMGRAQVMQAECAGILPDIRMNPILLKPNSDTGSQVIVDGEVIGNMRASEYFAYKHNLIKNILNSYNSLSDEYDIIVLEGAGSPAEINLKNNDIVNMGMATMAKSPVLLVGDINPGGVFASIAGTLQLLEPHERDMLKGVIINKFRGDPNILEPGLVQLEEIIHKPVLGVVPYMNIDVDDEDSLSSRLDVKDATIGLIDIAVIRLPRLSNFTDFASLDSIAGVKVRYVGTVSQLGQPDLIIIPGTKNTMGDLQWLRQCGLEPKIAAYAESGGPIFGICGGYQMLGETLKDPLEIEYGGSMAGLGLVRQNTVFKPQKKRSQVRGKVGKIGGIFKGISGASFEGYEIHMGSTSSENEDESFCQISGECDQQYDGVAWKNIYGTYVHGIFDSNEIANGIVNALLIYKGLNPNDVKIQSYEEYKLKQYDILATTLRTALDMEKIYKIVDAGI